MTGEHDQRPCAHCGALGAPRGCDCADRIACVKAGEPGHYACGFCEHDKPAFTCCLVGRRGEARPAEHPRSRHRIRYSHADRMGFIVCVQKTADNLRPVLSVDVEDAIEFESREAGAAWLLRYVDARVVSTPGELVGVSSEPRAWIEPIPSCTACGSPDGAGGRLHACLRRGR